VIQPNPSRNVTVGVEVQFHPQKLFERSPADVTRASFGQNDGPN